MQCTHTCSKLAYSIKTTYNQLNTVHLQGSNRYDRITSGSNWSDANALIATLHIHWNNATFAGSKLGANSSGSTLVSRFYNTPACCLCCCYFDCMNSDPLPRSLRHCDAVHQPASRRGRNPLNESCMAHSWRTHRRYLCFPLLPRAPLQWPNVK